MVERLYPTTNPSAGRLIKHGIYATCRVDHISVRCGNFNNIGCGRVIGEEVDKVDQDMAEEVVEEAAAHIIMGFTSHMSPITLNIQIGLNSWLRQEKG